MLAGVQAPYCAQASTAADAPRPGLLHCNWQLQVSCTWLMFSHFSNASCSHRKNKCSLDVCQALQLVSAKDPRLLLRQLALTSNGEAHRPAAALPRPARPAPVLPASA